MMPRNSIEIINHRTDHRLINRLKGIEVDRSIPEFGWHIFRVDYQSHVLLHVPTMKKLVDRGAKQGVGLSRSKRALHHLWQLIPHKEDSYLIVNRKTGRRLADSAGSENCTGYTGSDVFNDQLWRIQTFNKSQDKTFERLISGKKLVWKADFSIDGPADSAEWKFETGYKRNHEEQFYQQGNAFYESNRLVIEARHDTTDQKHPLTSASLLSKKSWRYGVFRIIARFPLLSGVWPAIWFTGASQRKWPQKGEIDLMEYYRGMILANACWGPSKQKKPIWESSKHLAEEVLLRSDRNGFHEWLMFWDSKQIYMFLDGQLLQCVDIDRTVTDDYNPFHHKQQLRLNLALGGDNGGVIDLQTLPVRFEVAAVEVWA